MKNIIKHLFAVLLLFSVFIPLSHSSVWKKAVSQVSREINQIQEDTQETQNIINQEKQELKTELLKINKDVEQDEKELARLKESFDLLLQEEQDLKNEIETGEKQTQALANVLRTAAKDTETMIENSPVNEKILSMKPGLLSMTYPDRFPGMDDIENLGKILLAEMESGGKIQKYTGTYIDEHGNETSGEIIQAGRFSLYYKQGEKTGYLRFDSKIQKLAAVPGTLPRSVRQDIKNYYEGKQEYIPLDLTGGIIAEQVSKSGNIEDWLNAGGILVWPILLIAVVSLIISLERLWSLGRIPVQTDKIMDKLRQMAGKGDWKGCRELCTARSHMPVCNVLSAGLQYRDSDKEVLENAMEESILKQMPRLERFLTTLSVLAAIAPLLGLLGTVTGMIHTFQGITVFGTSDPKMMSGGISQALITTQLGLAVAIPIIIIHHFFDRRVEKIIGDMEEKGTALITTLINIRTSFQEN
ncbi:MotA/TolQ/ExbB proton channel domain-containing protein [Desulfonema limicola]|uniref:MotA/TolQ/ExbB proton channel domain-containing protein n=1 Tax=Desulfonema limicola TaxID=45656 RepID=A0A975BDY3_9BACT|nr:MotA/TolQ/ExbB proton channel family protein [Desulfonema limicola]QTA83752.1 MotA/TolQ/ExbB proton channel domain-containing protein [Desulfonema limicola]